MASTIELKSTPGGAEITIDGKYVGNAPTTLHLSVGDYAIKFEKPGFKSWERTGTGRSSSEGRPLFVFLICEINRTRPERLPRPSTWFIIRSWKIDS